MHFPQRHAKRQDPPNPAVPSGDGLGGAITISNTVIPTSLIISSGAPDLPTPTSLPPLANGFTFTSTVADLVTVSQTPASSSSPSPSSAQALNSSSLSLSTVVAACVGAFGGLALLICLFIWWTRHNSTKNRRGRNNMPRSPMAENRNAHGETERQQRVRSGAWNKLDESGGARSPASPGGQHSTEDDSDEKNFSMFKKRTLSTRTTRTARALEEHGIDMPPITKYHPDLAKELALQEPERPFTQRQESGVSWDGETLGDDSFLSLRSVRIESGTMSPTLGGVAKMTPPAMPSQLHKWESAEVLTVDESLSPPSENPFADVTEERRKSHGNPFFNAGDVHRSASRRSRSNSRGSLGRSTSKRGRSRPNVMSEGSQIDPFTDLNGTAELIRELPTFSHGASDSVASGSTTFGSDRAMKSLIAALDVSQEEVEERLRAVSMQPSIDSRYSSLFRELEEDVGITMEFPPAPTTLPPAPTTLPPAHRS